MATRNIVPRATGEGSIGTSAKTWGAGYFDDLTVTGQGSLSDYLPLAGGTMSGAINFSDATEGKLQNDSVGNASSMRIFGGQGYTNGAYVAVYGKNNSSYAGRFRIAASDGVNTKILQGQPDGTLTWDSNSLITKNANVQAGTTASTSVAAGSSEAIAITFSPAFSSAPIVIATVQTTYGGFYASVGSITTSGASIRLNNTSASTRSVPVSWVAISI